jgi:hypothetical protein
MLFFSFVKNFESLPERNTRLTDRALRIGMAGGIIALGSVMYLHHHEVKPEEAKSSITLGNEPLIYLDTPDLIASAIGSLGLAVAAASAGVVMSKEHHLDEN